MKNRNRKVPGKKETPPSKGKPRRTQWPEIIESQKPVWSISIIDRCGEWGWNNVKNEILWKNILSKMRYFEGMPWGEILRKKTTSLVPVDEFYPEAKRRLREIKMYDTDELLHLGLSGKERIWGIRIGRVFQILWWDPDHTVCPSYLRNT